MKYRVEIAEKAKRSLKKMDKPQQRLIVAWLEKNLDGCENPRQHGRPLVGNQKGFWRYRVGDYRLIAEIQDDRICILILSAGHRSEIYQK